MSATRLVFLHAYPLHGGMWDDARALLPADWETTALTFPGFCGQSPPTSVPSIVPFAETTIAHLESQGPATLVGLSLGGYVMGEVSRLRPDLVRGLVFCDTRLTPDGDEERARRERNAQRIEREGVEFLVREYLPNCVGGTSIAHRPEVVERAAEAIRASTVEGLAWAMRAMAARADTQSPVRAAAVPGHVIVGEEDALCDASDRAALAAATGGPVTVLPGVGHYSALEDPAAFAAALTDAVESWSCTDD